MNLSEERGEGFNVVIGVAKNEAGLIEKVLDEPMRGNEEKERKKERNYINIHK